MPCARRGKNQFGVFLDLLFPQRLINPQTDFNGILYSEYRIDSKKRTHKEADNVNKR